MEGQGEAAGTGDSAKRSGKSGKAKKMGATDEGGESTQADADADAAVAAAKAGGGGGVDAAGGLEVAQDREDDEDELMD